VENHGPQAATAACLFLVLSWLFVSLRCYCKIAVLHSFGPDDFLCIVTQVLFTFYGAFVLVGVHYGAGKHDVDIIPPTNIPICLKWWWFGEQFYCLTSSTLKFSIGLFLLRIAVHKTQKVIVWIVMIVSSLMGIYSFCLLLFQCRPITYFWGQYSGIKGSCINPMIISRTAYAFSAVSCWSDWTFCILPGFIIWNLEMNPRTKVSVLLLFALGTVASTITIVRFPYLSALNNKANFLYATTNVGVLSTIEIGIGITTVAAVTIRPLFRHFLGPS
ncbi:hypothetical protein L207DRAFT_391412, partial [Hyaloscypha variabilis F]